MCRRNEHLSYKIITWYFGWVLQPLDWFHCWWFPSFFCAYNDTCSKQSMESSMSPLLFYQDSVHHWMCMKFCQKKKPVNYLGDHQKWHQSSGGKTHQKYQVYNSGYYKFWFERSRWRQSPEKCFGPTKYDVIFIYQYWVDTTASGLMIHQGISS